MFVVPSDDAGRAEVWPASGDDPQPHPPARVPPVDGGGDDGPHPGDEARPRLHSLGAGV